MGPPGAGKGTQAQLLAEKFDLYHFETSKIIEKNFANIDKNDFVKVDGEKYFLLKEKKLRDSGKWMSPSLISFWTKNKIRDLEKESKGIVISGSPKTLHEAQEITPLLKKNYGSKNIKVILLKQRSEVSIRRNSRRRICELMRHSILYNKENSRMKFCPLDGSKLIYREDSSPKIIREKLEEYKERTLPIINYFKREGIRIREINGENPIIDVFKNILKAFK